MKKISKKVLSLLLVTVLLLSMAFFSNFGELFSTTARAQEFTEGYYTYTFDGIYSTIVGVDTSISGDIVIPETLGGRPILTIGNNAFSNCTHLTSVVFSERVGYLQTNSFFGCSNLKKVSFSLSLVFVNSGSFSGCNSLTDVYYGGNENNWNAFVTVKEKNENLLNANRHYAEDRVEGNFTYFIHNGYATIRKVDPPFGNILVIPQTLGGYPVKVISNYSFLNLSATRVILPDSLTHIGYSAFSGCNNLKEIYIPKSLIYVDSLAFWNCGALIDIYYDGTHVQWDKITVVPENPDFLFATRYFITLPESSTKTARFNNRVTVKFTATRVPYYFNCLEVDGNGVFPNAQGTAILEKSFTAKGRETFNVCLADNNGEPITSVRECNITVDTSFFAKFIGFYKDFLFNGFKWREVMIEF